MPDRFNRLVCRRGEAGDERGTALLAGHTVSTGGGAFDDLEDLAIGDRVAVVTGENWDGQTYRSSVVVSATPI